MEDYIKENEAKISLINKEKENNNIIENKNELKIIHKFDNKKLFNEILNEIYFQIKNFGLLFYSIKFIMSLSLDTIKFVKMKKIILYMDFVINPILKLIQKKLILKIKKYLKL